MSDEVNSGKVFLVGAGPGKGDYFTVYGQRLLRRADALVYDALIDSSILQQLPAACEQWHVGKRGGQPSTPQAEINRLLVRLCQAGQQVVRLKSGDPFILAGRRQKFRRSGPQTVALKWYRDCLLCW